MTVKKKTKTTKSATGVKKTSRKKTSSKKAATMKASKSKKASSKIKAKSTTTTKRVTRKAKTKKDTFTQSPQFMLDESTKNQMIAEAAYFLAEKNGFESGNELGYWVAAEREIISKISNNELR